MNIFVGNLHAEVTDKELESLFVPFGEVKSVKIILDGFTRRSRGFAFVEMMERGHGENAITSLNNSSFHSQAITVNEARPKTGGSEFRKN